MTQDQTNHPDVFKRLGLSARPVMLAPLAGVSDAPFRLICSQQGAELTYVEMLSATALLYNSRRTLAMLHRHQEEPILGVQLTGKTPEETAAAVEILDGHGFETIDINMGCPVRKVVKTGCGSAILKDPKRVEQTVRLSRARTKKPLSVKIRIGWDRQSVNGVEVAKAAEAAGAEWITVHGRTRSDDYSVPVDLAAIAEICHAVKIPVIGNGNIFGRHDAQHMAKLCGVRGWMVSRGALGNPWAFDEIRGRRQGPPGVQGWLDVVTQHLRLQLETYGREDAAAAVRMRKHLLWYTKGWPAGKRLREQINGLADLGQAQQMVDEFAASLAQSQTSNWRRQLQMPTAEGERFSWDPKFDMDRQLDRGVDEI